ncbi:MAG: NADH-quinone oxidoreductase subunit NuoE [Thermoplasmata archaeon]|nr:NADH-quinone oxidoreductase subunit NuoE [Thermoplasmata archaeon]
MNPDEKNELDGMIARVSDPVSGKIQLLQMVQETYGWLSEEHMRYIAGKIGTSYQDLFSVATFYAQFKFNKPGRTVIKVCRGTACHVRGGAQVLKEAKNLLGIKPGQTTEDGEYSLETVACVGACALAPTVVLGSDVHRRMTAKKMAELLRESGGGWKKAEKAPEPTAKKPKAGKSKGARK